MLQVHDPQRRELVAGQELPRKGWIHAISPGPEERLALVDRGVPPEFIAHALDPHELGRVDRIGRGETLVVIRVPQVQSEGHRSTTLAVVIVGDLMVTIASGPLQVIGELAGRAGLGEVRPFRVLVELLLITAAVFVKRVNDIDEDVDRLEDKLQTAQRNEDINELLQQQKALVHLERALASNQIMLERLQKDDLTGMNDEERELLEDAIIEFHQAIQTTKISADILSSMMDAFTSMISNNLNQVMKVLASLTVMIAIPTMVAGLWGMNVHLPGEDHAWAFWVLLGATASASLALALVFARKKWI